MNTILEKIALTLFLILGMGFYNATHAEVISEDKLECSISGQVSLRLTGDHQHGSLDGFAANQYVSLNVMNGTVNGFMGGQYVNLRLTPERNEYLLAGFISSTYIRWTSFGKQFSEWVYCR